MNETFLKPDFILFANRCPACAGTGFAPVATADNPDAVLRNTPGLPCPQCIRGYVMRPMAPSQFVKELIEAVATELVSKRRDLWYDAVVDELEKRIRDAELKIMSTEAVARQQPATPAGAVSGSSSFYGTIVQHPSIRIGDAVLYKGRSGYCIPNSVGCFLNYGDRGTVIEVRGYVAKDGPPGYNLFVRFDAYPNYNVPLPLANLEKIP